MTSSRKVTERNRPRWGEHQLVVRDSRNSTPRSFHPVRPRGDTARLEDRHRLLGRNAELPERREQEGVLVFEMLEYGVDLLFGSHIHLEIVFRAQFRMAALQILPNHDERHEKNLNDVADQEVGHKRWKRVEGVPMRRRYQR